MAAGMLVFFSEDRRVSVGGRAATRLKLQWGGWSAGAWQQVGANENPC